MHHRQLQPAKATQCYRLSKLWPSWSTRKPTRKSYQRVWASMGPTACAEHLAVRPSAVRRGQRRGEWWSMVEGIRARVLLTVRRDQRCGEARAARGELLADFQCLRQSLATGGLAEGNEQLPRYSAGAEHARIGPGKGRARLSEAVSSLLFSLLRFRFGVQPLP